MYHNRGRLTLRPVRLLAPLVALAALAAIAAALWHLTRATDGLVVRETRVGATPVTIYRPAGDGPAPVVVVAHGFSGSQQLMQPFAITLARNGFLGATFDFLGHGRNPVPMAGGLADREARSRALVDELDRVATYARGLPASDGRLAVLGHSMASDVVVRYAVERPDVAATIAVSLFSSTVTPTAPKNLLVIVGALEDPRLIAEGARAAGLGAGVAAEEGVLYGAFADGTARRLVLSDGVEHIGVLYSAESLSAAVEWLNAAFERPPAVGFLDAPGPWLALLFAGIVALAWPLSRMLPRVADAPVGAGLPWRRLWPVAVAPAVLTPLILWKLPTQVLPVLLADYLAVHFGLYGLLTAAGLALVGWRIGKPTGVAVGRLVVAAALVAAYGILGIGGAIERYVFAFVPIPERAPYVLAMLVGTVPFFVADEWATRGPGAARLAYPATKALFLASLVLAIALNLSKLFFLAIIIPAMLVFLVMFGSISGWAYRRTLHPLVGGLANAAIFAWAIAVTFPLVAR